MFGCGKDNSGNNKPGSIYGTVTDKSSGDCVPNAGVELMPKGLKTVTGSDGTFQFTEIDPGQYNLYITKVGYQDFKSNSITVKAGETAKGDVQIEKTPTSLQIVDNSGNTITEVDFGSDEGVNSKTFNIFNGGIETLNYTITKTADWIENISQPTGSVNVGVTFPIILKINRELLIDGLNSTTLLITSPSAGGVELVVKATKEHVEWFSLVDNNGNEITELDFGADDYVTQKTFNIRNDGTQNSYTITKTANWISSIDPMSGELNAGALVTIVVTINRDMLNNGNNATKLLITSGGSVSVELVVKANKTDPSAQRTVVFQLYDSYGDGWNGASLGINGDDGIQEDLTCNSSYDSYSFAWFTGTNITVTYYSGQYDSESSYKISYDDGTVIYEKQQGTISSGFQCSFVVGEELPGPPLIEDWLYYGEWNNHSNFWGLTDGGADEWAVMFPASLVSQYSGCSISKVTACVGVPGSYTIKIYEGYDIDEQCPITLLKSQSFSVSEACWKTVTLSSAVALPNNKALWVSVYHYYNAGEYPAGACAGVGDRNARWKHYISNYSYDDYWYDVYDNNNNVDLCWEIQVFVTNEVKGEKGFEIQLPKTLVNPEKTIIKNKVVCDPIRKEIDSRRR